MTDAQTPKQENTKKRGARGARRRSREFALKGIYEWLLTGADAASIDAAATETEDFEHIDAELYRELLNGVIDNFTDLEASYAIFIDRDVKSLSPIERSILLIGTYELKHSPQTPYRVIINEAVELAKSFGGSEGYRYVNGVLDKLVKEYRAYEIEAK